MTETNSAISLSDFLADANKSDLFERANQEVQKEISDEELQEIHQKEAANWNILANQVVGHEDF